MCKVLTCYLSNLYNILVGPDLPCLIGQYYPHHWIIKIIKIKIKNALFPGEDFAVVQQEIIMMKDCKHPNIVAYFGSYLRYVCVYIVFFFL